MPSAVDVWIQLSTSAFEGGNVMSRLPRAPLAVLVFWLALYSLTASGRITPGDEETMFQVTDSLMTHGWFDISHATVLVEPFADGYGILPSLPSQLSAEIQTTSAVPGRNGRLYSKYGLGQSVAAIPFWLLGRLLSWLTPGLGHDYAVRFAASFLNGVATALTAWLVFDTSLALGYRPATAMALSLSYGLATMAWPYAKNWYSEPSVTMLVLLTFDAGIRIGNVWSRRDGWSGGVAFALAVLFRITTLIWLPAFLLLFIGPGTGNRRARAAAILIPALLAVALTGIYNIARFGSPLSFGYPEAHWDSPIVLGLIGLLGSAGKGLFYYNPPLMLGLAGLVLWFSAARGRRVEGATVLALATLTLGYVAPYRFWTGGWNWGPRFLLPLIPMMLLPAGALLELARSRLVPALWVASCVLGVLVNLPAVLVDHSRYLISASEHDPAGYYDRSIWEPAHSPIVRQWPMVAEVWSLWRTQHAALAHAARRFPVDARGLAAREEFLRWNLPDFWQAHWSVLALPMWLPWVASVVCLAALFWASWRMRAVIMGSG